jgi:hypothetical protein
MTQSRVHTVLSKKTFSRRILSTADNELIRQDLFAQEVSGNATNSRQTRNQL